jgi:hypothetical protein
MGTILIINAPVTPCCFDQKTTPAHQNEIEMSKGLELNEQRSPWPLRCALTGGPLG